MSSVAQMTTDELASLLAVADARIRDLDHLMARTPRNTTAFAAMAESRPGLLRFRHGLDDALASRGARRSETRAPGRSWGQQEGPMGVLPPTGPEASLYRRLAVSIIRVHRPPVKPTRRSPRPSAAFGAGLFRFVPTAVLAPGFTEPSDEDRDAAVLLFADEPAASLEEQARQAAWDDQFRAVPPPAGICRSCGDHAEELSWGLCPDCLDDAATHAAIAGRNERAGLGYRVF